MTGDFPTQKASNADFFSIWWRHHDLCRLFDKKTNQNTPKCIFDSTVLDTNQRGVFITFVLRNYSDVSQGLISYHLSPRVLQLYSHDGVMTWKRYARYWPFMRESVDPPLDFGRNGHWCVAVIFLYSKWAWTNYGINSRVAKSLIIIFLSLSGCEIDPNLYDPSYLPGCTGCLKNS